MNKLLTAIFNICCPAWYTININCSRCVRPIIVESMCTRKHLSQLSAYCREKNEKTRSFFFIRILYFCTRFHPLHLYAVAAVWKCNEFSWWIFVPILGIAELYVFLSSDSALLHIPTAFETYLFRRNIACGIHTRVYLAFLTELINWIKRTCSTTLCAHFSLLHIRINYFGTI